MLNKIGKEHILTLLGIAAFFLIANYLKKLENTTLDDMSVVLTAKVPKDDVFQLFYWEATASKFKMANSVRTKIKGSEDFQEIVFELPKIKDLFRLRLDIGENFEQETVNIREIKFIKEAEELVFGIKGFNRLFSANKYIVSIDNHSFSGKTGTSKSKTIYDPYFISVDGSREMESIRLNRLTKHPYLVAAFICLVLVLFVMYNLNSFSISKEGTFVAVFVIVLIMPTLQNQIQFTKPLENLEKRELVKIPEFTWTKEFARGFESYYNDNFGLRNNFVDWGGTFRTKFFRSSMHPEKVMMGKQKWLYYNNFNSHIYDSYRRVNLLTQDTLQRIVTQWEDNKERFAVEGRKYFIVFWPNKHSIYSEYLPSTMKVQIKDTVSRVDQISTYMKRHNTSVKLVDVRQKLIDAKKTGQVYHKFDTHWNDYGAFLAYRTFFQEIQGDLAIAPKKEKDFHIVWEDYRGGDLISMLGVRNNGFFTEKRPKFVLKKDKDQIQYLPIEGYPKLTVRTRNEHCDNKLKALIFRDSYTNSLVQFFSLHFYEVTYIWGHKEYYVKKVQPDVIIDGFVEREIGEKHTINKL
jgi:hypothetical protein